MEIRGFTVGPVQENCYIVRGEGEHEDRCFIVDPGDEAPVLLAPVEELGMTVDAIILTHCHFDHVGAVAPVAKATGAEVWCPKLEVPLVQEIKSYSFPGIPEYEGYDPEHTVEGGETLKLAGYELEVIFTPGHSPGHVTYAIAADGNRPTQLFSGDVLFQSSIGRTDLPGGDHQRLLQSIAELIDRFEDDATVYPGHMDLTTLGRERRTNPFLQGL